MIIALIMSVSDSAVDVAIESCHALRPENILVFEISFELVNLEKYEPTNFLDSGSRANFASQYHLIFTLSFDIVIDFLKYKS